MGYLKHMEIHEVHEVCIGQSVITNKHALNQSSIIKPFKEECFYMGRFTLGPGQNNVIDYKETDVDACI
jgi:hypothetical protein